MAFKWTSPSPQVRRLGALAALAMLALSIACSKNATAPAPPRDLNVAPVAQFQASAGCTSAPVSLDASASHDPDGSIRLYEWDFESDGTIDTSGAALVVVQHPYTPGPHRAKLVVTDNFGAYTITVQSFVVASPETLYVSVSGSLAGPGTRLSPFGSLTNAIAAATPLACPTTILVANGRYVETPALASNLTIRGGYNPVTWTHAPGDQSEIAGRSAMAVDVQNTEVSYLRFWSGDLSEPSMSAIACGIQNCDASLCFVRCAFVGGIPGNGLNGAGGDGGYPGAPGGDGTDGWGHSGEWAIGARNSAIAGGEGASPTRAAAMATAAAGPSAWAGQPGAPTAMPAATAPPPATALRVSTDRVSPRTDRSTDSSGFPQWASTVHTVVTAVAAVVEAIAAAPTARSAMAAEAAKAATAACAALPEGMVAEPRSRSFSSTPRHVSKIALGPRTGLATLASGATAHPPPLVA